MRVAVRFHMVLGGFFRVIFGLNVMAVRQMDMVSGGFVVAVLVMLGGFLVMACSVLVVLRRLCVVLAASWDMRRVPSVRRSLHGTGGLSRDVIT